VAGGTQELILSTVSTTEASLPNGRYSQTHTVTLTPRINRASPSLVGFESGEKAQEDAFQFLARRRW
jgi:hypothetical protein